MDSAIPLSEPRRGLRLEQTWPLLLGLAAMTIPTIISLGQQVWSKESGAHGPIILATGLWLVWRKREEIEALAVPGRPWVVALGVLLSLPLYVFGRAYDFMLFEAAGCYGAILTALYAHVGERAMLKSWFPLLYLGFMVPPPGWMMDHITSPLKLFVSKVATEGLQMFGIPIIHQGVTLIVAQYQLLVEDACSGMNSLTGLVAISLFYIYLLRNASWRYSLLLVCLVIPIAVVANIIRIVILVLLTYFFGNAVAQGFLHETAGMVLFATSLLLVFLLDNIFSRIRGWLGRA
ncbi:MAG TPA: exosortase V [Phenylobacterium sp.]|nr:exosortase V [Phenylobacterium sp.]